MSDVLLRSRRAPVVAAVAAVVLLAGALAAQLLATAPPAPTPPAAPALPPATTTLDAIPLPWWGSQESSSWPVEFRTNLDLLAPLGTGGKNAAVWFAEFEKNRGRRYADAQAAMARRFDGPGHTGSILPPDDPLLREAEPWCDQATMRFYPDIFPLGGYRTRIANLLLPLTFARSWVARGLAARDATAGLDDCRRAIRLGRLLRQENVIVIADLVGLACIRLGADGMYTIATRTGNAQLALIAAIVQGEAGAQRLLTAEHLTKVDVAPDLHFDSAGKTTLTLDDAKLDAIAKAATTDPDHRFRGEALVTLNLVAFLASDAQRARAHEALDEVARSSDRALAASAAWCRDTAPDKAYLEELKPAP